jgi:hypothetical protein
MYRYRSMVLKFTTYLICTSIYIQKQINILSKFPSFYNEYCNTIGLEMKCYYSLLPVTVHMTF